MDWNNLITLISVGIGTSAAAYVGYSRQWPTKTSTTAAPVLTSIGLELGNREQTERLISEVHGCRLALEILADRRTEEMEDIHRELLDRLDRQEEQEESGPRKHPPRRR